jgi:hypothetical protein
VIHEPVKSINNRGVYAATSSIPKSLGFRPANLPEVNFGPTKEKLEGQAPPTLAANAARLATRHPAHGGRMRTHLTEGSMAV